MADIQPVLDFLRCRTPAAWLEHAVLNRDALLLDHASLELKAAQQAQKIIWKYGASDQDAPRELNTHFRRQLVHKMSRLAREELRHFEQVVALLEQRGKTYNAVSASRYAPALHGLAHKRPPGAIVDTLIIGAVIEARSCERFYSLVPLLEPVDAALAKFYASLLQSEARHFTDYLELARNVCDDDIADRVDEFLVRDAELVVSVDAELRFHSGTPVEGHRINP